MHKLSDAKYFSKLDAKNGYWLIKLDPESQLLTTFNSLFGRYCFQRMPFGLIMSQYVFQQKMDDSGEMPWYIRINRQYHSLWHIQRRT